MTGIAVPPTRQKDLSDLVMSYQPWLSQRMVGTGVTGLVFGAVMAVSAEETNDKLFGTTLVLGSCGLLYSAFHRIRDEIDHESTPGVDAQTESSEPLKPEAVVPQSVPEPLAFRFTLPDNCTIRGESWQGSITAKYSSEESTVYWPTERTWRRLAPEWTARRWEEALVQMQIRCEAEAAHIQLDHTAQVTFE